MFDLSDDSTWEILISDGWRNIYIPKVPLEVVVDEPNITLQWDDHYKGGTGAPHTLTMDYIDVFVGYSGFVNAQAVADRIAAYRLSAFGGGGTGDVVGPGSAADSNLAAFDGTDGKLLKDSGESVASLKAYADSLVVGLWDDRGSFDASGGSYPSTGGSGTAGAILKGDIWTISVAGTLPTGQAVEVGDIVRALVDTPGNTQANWAITQNNIGYVAENSANKTDVMAGNTASSIKYLSTKGTFDWASATFQATLVSGTNIKTINSTSLLGSGDVAVQATLVSGTNIKSVNGSSLLGAGNLIIKNYWIPVYSLSGTITSGATRYFGNILRTVGATATEQKIYFREAGTITIAQIIFFASGTVGTNENITISIRLNNTTDTAVATVGAATVERQFTNTALAIAIAAGDYIEMKIVTPSWATPPTAVLLSGNLIFVGS